MSLKLPVFMMVFALLGAGACLASPAVDEPTARNAIQKILTEQQSAWNRGDVKEFLQGYWHSPDLTFSGSGGTTRGWDGVLARYQKSYPSAAAMGHLDFSDLEFRILGEDSALVLGKWHLMREKDELGGVFTLVWRKFPEGWRIIHDHTSLVTRNRDSSQAVAPSGFVGATLGSPAGGASPAPTTEDLIQKTERN